MTTFIDTIRHLPKLDAMCKVVNLLVEHGDELIDADAVSNRIAQSNATGWECDGITGVDLSLDDKCCRANITFHASGDSDDDRLYAGSQIYGAATAIVDENGSMAFEDVRVLEMQ